MDLTRLRGQLQDIADAERFEGPRDIEGRVVRRVSDYLRRAQRSGALGRVRSFRVHSPEPGVVEVLLQPPGPTVKTLVLHTSPVG